MPAPHGTQVDLNIIQKRIGRLILTLGRDKMTLAQALVAEIVTDLTTIKNAIDAATQNVDLEADPTLEIYDTVDPDAF